MNAMAEADPDDVMRLLTAGRDREAAQRGLALARTATPHNLRGGHMDPLTQFEQLGPVLGGVIAGLQPDQLDEPTPCAQFTVRGVLEHMIGGATIFAAAYRGEAAPEPDFGDPIAGVQSALGELAASITAPGALERTIHAPFGDVDGESFAHFVVLDGLVHGWDLAIATSQSYEPPADLVAASTAFARQALDPLRDGQTFKPAVDAGAGATPIERLAAYTGRTVPEAAR
jgi:uncharacterized protein (TIGR03086 family)